MPDNKESTNKENNKENKQYFFDNPKNTKWVMNIFYACCVLVVVLDFVINRHVYHSWENLPAFYPLYGFVGCVVLVVIARWMRTFLMRSEDYYDDESTQQAANNQTETKKVGDHNVDA